MSGSDTISADPGLLVDEAARCSRCGYITAYCECPAGPRRQWGRKKGDPAPNKGKRFPPEALTSEELSAIVTQCALDASTGIRNRAMILLLARSGLRVSEMLGSPERGIPPMRVSAVDFKMHSIRLLHTKSGKPQTRGFHPSVDDALRRWLDERKRLGLARNGTPLFCTLGGEPVSRQYLTKKLKELADKAGIDKRVHPHGLRHTFAVEQRRAGTPIEVVSKLLGHSSVAVTVRYLGELTNGEAIATLVTADLPSLE